MELFDQLLQTAAIVAPGFVAMKLIYIFGAQRQRAQWEWTVWSVLVGLGCDVAARWLVGLSAGPALLPVDVALVLLRFVIALVFAALVILAWGFLKHSDAKFRAWFKWPETPRVWLRRALTDSAWDEVVDDAVLHERWMDVITDGPAGEMAFRGWLAAGGREDAKAEPWLYLRRVQRRDSTGWNELPGTHGMLIHRDHIQRIRVLETVGQDKAPSDQYPALRD